jgi:hypothetical protein
MSKVFYVRSACPCCTFTVPVVIYFDLFFDLVAADPDAIFSHRSIHRRKATAKSSWGMVRTTPLCFFGSSPGSAWGQSAPTSLAETHKKKVRCGEIRRTGRLPDRLDAFATLWSPRMRRRQCAEESYLYGNQSWDNGLGNRLVLSRGLYSVSHNDDFAARLSGHWMQQKPRRRRSFSSFWWAFVFNYFDEEC